MVFPLRTLFRSADCTSEQRSILSTLKYHFLLGEFKSSTHVLDKLWSFCDFTFQRQMNQVHTSSCLNYLENPNASLFLKRSRGILNLMSYRCHPLLLGYLLQISSCSEWLLELHLSFLLKDFLPVCLCLYPIS